MSSSIRAYLYTFLLSLVPVVELRGAIPLGYGLGLPWLHTYLLCVLGNMLPVPFILLFIRAILRFMKKIPKLDRIALWVERKADKCSARVMRSASFGLFLFVAIPLPGTGAWTGALVAAMLNMRMKYALPSIFAGVLTAGFLVTGICYGFLDFLRFLL